MKKPFWQQAQPHVIAIVVFLVVSALYCAPALKGLVVNQYDSLGWRGGAQQSFNYAAIHGDFPLWTNSMFGGMPGFQIAMPAPNLFTLLFFKKLVGLWLPQPINFFFIACWAFYLLCIVIRINPWLAIGAALAYSFSTYDPIIIAVGHVTKMEAIAYMPAILASILLVFQRKWLTGSALLALFMGLQTSTSHFQIIYYTAIAGLLIAIAYFAHSIRQKQVMPAIKSLALCLVASVIGVLTYAVFMLPTYDYAKETMRGGGTDLTLNKDKELSSKGGLDKDYAFTYSVGIPETLTFVVPNIYGGGSDGKQFSENSEFVEKMAEMRIDEETALQMENAYGYWGPQGPTSGPVYLGAVICFLFILSFFFTSGWLKWGLLAAAIAGVILAWGKNLAPLNYFLFDHLPFYNKFRAPSMALVIPQLCFPALGALALQQIMKGEMAAAESWKRFRSALYVTGGLAVILVGFYFTQDFRGPSDNRLRDNFAGQMAQSMSQGGQASPQIMEQATQTANGFMTAIRNDRKHIYGSDLVRSLIFILLAAGLAGAFLKGKIKGIYLMAGIILLSSIDLLAVGRRYLNSSNYVEKDDYENFFTPTAADQMINADSTYFRVYDQSGGSPFQDATGARASYYHNSVGGYHAAKLALYQDLIDNQLSKGNMQVFNMLNTKYFIQNNPSTRQPVAFRNPDAFGPCWLVQHVHFVKDADEEMLALDSINVKDTAIVQQKFQSIVGQQPQYDSSAVISLVYNENDVIKYHFKADAPQFAVFSEIYYPRGWNVTIDGKPASYCKVDYVLRGMPVPAGEHEIEFRFEPKSYQIGSTLTIASTMLVYVLLILAALAAWKKKELV